MQTIDSVAHWIKLLCNLRYRQLILLCTGSNYSVIWDLRYRQLILLHTESNYSVIWDTDNWSCCALDQIILYLMQTIDPVANWIKLLCNQRLWCRQLILLCTGSNYSAIRDYDFMQTIDPVAHWIKLLCSQRFDGVEAWVVGNQLTILVGAVLIYHCWARCVRFWLGCTVMIGQAGHLSVGR